MAYPRILFALAALSLPGFAFAAGTAAGSPPPAIGQAVTFGPSTGGQQFRNVPLDLQSSSVVPIPRTNFRQKFGNPFGWIGRWNKPTQAKHGGMPAGPNKPRRE